MAELTEKEYYELDEFFTKNTIMPSGKSGFLSRNKGIKFVFIDEISDNSVPNYPNTKMFTAKRPPSAVMRNLAKKEFAMA